MREIIRDEDGTALVEFTIILPVIFALLAFGLSAFQLLNLRQSTAFVAQAAAASGARAFTEGCANCIANATQLATTSFNANQPAFLPGTTSSLGEIVALDSSGQPTTNDAAAKLLRVTVGGETPLWMPLFQSRVTSTVTVVD